MLTRRPRGAQNARPHDSWPRSRPDCACEAPGHKATPNSKLEDFGEAVGITGSLCLLIWPAFWFGEYAAPLIERILWIVGIHGFEASIKRWHASFSASPYSTWLLIGGFSCWGLCALLTILGGGLAQRAREKEKQRAQA